jgi:hypothetical protein
MDCKVKAEQDGSYTFSVNMGYPVRQIPLNDGL